MALCMYVYKFGILTLKFMVGLFTVLLFEHELARYAYVTFSVY